MGADIGVLVMTVLLCKFIPSAIARWIVMRREIDLGNPVSDLIKVTV